MLRRVLNYIREHDLLHAGDRVAVAVSGGADSVALLRLLLDLRAELGVVLSVAHFHHGIRGGAADADAAFAADLARQHQLPFHTAAGNAPAYAREHHLSLEAAARKLRYDFFWLLLTDRAADRLATAHTLDDQAETVLLRLVRGAGTRGLAGIWPKQQHRGSGIQAAIVRPLLCLRRAELEQYLGALGQAWREDATNLDLTHTRNRVRHALLPLLEREFNPAIRQVLAETAEIARAEEQFWEAQVASIAPRVDKSALRPDSVEIALLNSQPLALRRRMIRRLAEGLELALDFHHVECILRLISPGSGTSGQPASRSTGLPNGWRAVLEHGHLRFLAPKEGRQSGNGCGYEYRLRVPGQVRIAEIGKRISAACVSAGEAESRYNRAQLLDSQLLSSELVVRSWRPGDRFWPAHTKSPKKVKELLQERRVPAGERALWPVVASGENLIWMRGFPVPAQFAPAGDDAVLIQEQDEEPDE